MNGGKAPPGRAARRAAARIQAASPAPSRNSFSAPTVSHGWAPSRTERRASVLVDARTVGWWPGARIGLSTIRQGIRSDRGEPPPRSERGRRRGQLVHGGHAVADERLHRLRGQRALEPRRVLPRHPEQVESLLDHARRLAVRRALHPRPGRLHESAVDPAPASAAELATSRCIDSPDHHRVSRRRRVELRRVSAAAGRTSPGRRSTPRLAPPPPAARPARPLSPRRRADVQPRLLRQCRELEVSVGVDQAGQRRAPVEIDDLGYRRPRGESLTAGARRRQRCRPRSAAPPRPSRSSSSVRTRPPTSARSSSGAPPAPAQDAASMRGTCSAASLMARRNAGCARPPAPPASGGRAAAGASACRPGRRGRSSAAMRSV